MRSRLLSVALVPFLSAALCSAGLAQEVSDKPKARANTEPLKILPKNVLDAELRSADGTLFKLSDYSGQVLVIHLWATWCAPCMHEAPLFVKLHEQFRDQGVTFVDLSTESPDVATEEVQRWIRRYGVPYRSGFASADVALTLLQNRHALPQTFVISHSLLILKRFIGFNLDKTGLLLKKAIEDALKETEDGPRAP